MPSWVIILGLLLIAGWWFASTYNSLITSKGMTEKSWAQVEAEYQRRADLIPNLISTVKGAADFEQSTLTEVTEARTQWMQTADSPDATLEEQMAATQNFDSALSRLLVTVESYPTLTATEGFQIFQAQLEGTENRVTVARMDFNTAATAYNIKVQRFPTKIVASLFGFDPTPLFEAEAGSQEVPEVDFNFGDPEAVTQ
ncbi:LemA family protein [Candidatus Peregrinibacteria bacterium]|nr:MAG: LemA family protein [Candidatus Peregrinibacteria bacterium]